ncbi:MAG: UDP-N-acetylmuramoyl-L-alanyl-D-glutamate--2,6-diaminopimelate ligase [Acidobacteriota bacterium]
MVKIREIATAIDAQVIGDLDIEAYTLTHTTKNCHSGDIFVAIKGFKVNGNDFVSQAIAQGASAIISEQPRPDTCSLSWLQVTDARRALAEAAAVLYGFPSRALKLVGITGTNGKTTTAYLIDAIIRTAFGDSAMLTTVCNRINNIEQIAERTTPEASDIQRMLRTAVDAGCRGAVMEVSSHAIDLQRIAGLDFSTVVFTNLTQDHLDYHKTMENYFAVKRRLFDGSLGTERATAAINIDCPYGRQLIKSFAGLVITYGFSSQASVYVENYHLSLNGLNLTVQTPAGRLNISSSLVGKPHIYNILAATAAALSLDIELTTIARGIASLSCVPGRFDRVPCQEDFAVVVDYAHTDDALRNVLETAREVTRGRVICVFGCGGDKDRSKRPLMGEAAARYSDLVIATSDNPRSEDPDQIIAEAEIGLQRIGKPYHKISDRREAIHFAIAQAQPNDLVVIAGKGHENYQILRDRTIHFDDKEVAYEALQARRTTAGGRS